MTTTDARQPGGSALARAWRAFNEWRRGRPFWGGLLTIVAGVEFYLSAHLDLLPLKIQIGPQGFMTWLIPLLVLLCGVLLWVSPGQRIFYGVLAAGISVYSLIGLNFGGWILGLFLGIIGGALGASWTQLPAGAGVAAAPAPPPDPDGPDEEEPDVGMHILSGPLTDRLPTSQVSPLAARAGESGAETSGDESPGDENETQVIPVSRHAADESGTAPANQHRLGGNQRRLSGLGVVLVLAGSVAVAVLHQPTAAAAAPCPGTSASPTASGSAGATKPGAPGQPSPSTKPAPPAGGTEPSPSPSASPPAGDDGGLLGGLLDTTKKLLGIPPAPAPSPTAKAPAAKAPAAKAPVVVPPAKKPAAKQPDAGGTKKSSPSANPFPTGGTLKQRAQAIASGCASKATAPAPEGLRVNDKPSILTTDTLSMDDLTYRGIATLTTGHGDPLRCLEFTMSLSDTVPFKLQIPPANLIVASSDLKITGDVVFFTTRLDGKLFGVLPQTYTVDSPPPLPVGLTSPIPISFTGVTIALDFVYADKLTAANLDEGFPG